MLTAHGQMHVRVKIHSQQGLICMPIDALSTGQYVADLDWGGEGKRCRSIKIRDLMHIPKFVLMNKKETGKGVWGLATKNVGYCCMDWYELMHQPTDTYSQLSFEERVIFKNMTLTSRPETLNLASPQG